MSIEGSLSVLSTTVSLLIGSLQMLTPAVRGVGNEMTVLWKVNQHQQKKSMKTPLVVTVCNCFSDA